MPKSYPFTIYSGILEPKHYKKIGSALWLFLWFVSSTTKEVERDGVTWGIVLGNKPLKLNELAKIFDVNEKTVRRWLDDLEKHEYIKVTRAAYGLIITVKNSKKFKNERVDKNVQSRMDKNVHSEGEWTKMSNPEWTEMSTLPDKNVHSNKDITKIYINTTATTTKEEPDEIDLIANRFAELRSMQEGKPVYPKFTDYEAIAQIVAQGVPVSRTIELLDQCFKDYEIRNPGGKINSFNYCKKYILDRYFVDVSKEQAKKVGAIHGKNNSRSPGRATKTSPKPEPIFGDIVGRLPRRSNVSVP
jgi:DNA-binding transcriptional regulator YhcF (GntR family)